MKMNKKIILVIGLAYSSILFAQQWDKNKPQPLPPPPQDKGLPYTKSGYANARKAIQPYIAVFAGSRYAYVYGYKIRLDEADLLHGEAIIREGKIFVPNAFLSVLQYQKAPSFTPIPKGLDIIERKWVYPLKRTVVTVPATVQSIQYQNKTYVDLVAYCKQRQKNYYQNTRGLLLISNQPVQYQDADTLLADAVVTIFDTPDKYMEPDLATKYIPLLKQQGKWTDHAKYKPEDLRALMDGEVYNEWPRPTENEYSLEGFNKQLLGSKVPPPNVYPRLLFSPQDIPMLRKQLYDHKINRISLMETEILLSKTWFNPQTDDGKLFNKLASGDIDTLLKTVNTPALAGSFPGYKPGIYNSHIKYIPNCLVSIAFYALLTGNDSLGVKTANAIYHYCKIIEPLLDAQLTKTDSEIGISADDAQNSETHWRGIHGIIPHMDFPFLLDFGGVWMKPNQKKFVQNLIAKATYGRRTGGGDSPNRLWRDINHMTWHLTHHLSIATLEGLDGFDPEAFASGCELTKDFLDFGIDKYGQIFESNGKSGGGLVFQMLAMIMQDRRGSRLWGHPHWRKLVEAQIFTTSPNRKATLSSGTWGASPLTDNCYSMFKAFYPQWKTADYMLHEAFSGEGTETLKSFSPGISLQDFNEEQYRNKLQKSIQFVRLPGISQPGMTRSFLYNADWKSDVQRADLKMPDVWNDDVHGILSVSSNQTNKAAWLCLHVRDNHYFGTGHHHSDIGMFYFSSGGVNWITESPFFKTYSGKYHNLVLVDGKAEPNTPPAKGHYLGAALKPDGAIGTVDQTYAYSYQWCAQVQTWGTGFAKTDSIYGKDPWELETDPYVMKFYRGTGRYKVRPWWPSNNFSNYMPNLRAPWNPMQYVFRSAGLIKGTHAYGIIVDDLKKDSVQHQYEWTAMLAKGVWKADVTGLPTHAQALAYDEKLKPLWKKTAPNQAAITPKNGDPVLLVYALNSNDTVKVLVANDGNWDGEGSLVYNKIAIPHQSIEAHYKILLIPHTMGEALPKVVYQQNKATITWENQTDEIQFSTINNRTQIQVLRNGKNIIESK